MQRETPLTRARQAALLALVALLALAPASGRQVYIVGPDWGLPLLVIATAVAVFLVDRRLRSGLFVREDLWLVLWLASLVVAGLPDRADPDFAREVALRIAVGVGGSYGIAKAVVGDRALRAFLGAALLVAATAVAGFAVLESWLHWNPIHASGAAPNAYYDRYHSLGRPVATQFNPAALGSFLLLSGFLSTALLPVPCSPGRRRVVAGARALLVLGLLLTFSRAAALGLVAGCALWLVLAGRARWLLPMLVALALFSVAADHLPPPVSRFGLERLTTKAGVVGETRMQRLRIGMHIVRERPLLGVGVRQFGLHAKRIAAEEGIAARRGTRIPDQSYLALLTEAGLFGLGSFVLWIGALLRRALHAVHASPRDPALTAAIAGLVAALVNFMGYDALYWTSPSLLFALCAGTVVALSGGAVQEE